MDIHLTKRLNRSAKSIKKWMQDKSFAEYLNGYPDDMPLCYMSTIHLSDGLISLHETIEKGILIDLLVDCEVHIVNQLYLDAYFKFLAVAMDLDTLVIFARYVVWLQKQLKTRVVEAELFEAAINLNKIYRNRTDSFETFDFQEFKDTYKSRIQLQS